ncbi:MAG TPA: 50S ribosomal protein L29 [Myxococcales bacterium]|jgi:large subunit ribosomal protein L29|nr:50S ribosomal protein L29 [Myxococcales bacterium]
MATAKEMRDLSAEELRRRAAELRENLFNLRIKHRTGALESSAILPKSRKDLARVLTVLREKEQLAVE